MQVACQLVIAAQKRDAIGDLYEMDINASWTGQFMKGRSKYLCICFVANQLARCDIDFVHIYVCVKLINKGLFIFNIH